MDGSIASETMEEIRSLVAAGEHIKAIKLYREATGADLKSAKDFVDGLIDQLAEKDPELFAKAYQSKSGCGLTTVIMFAAILIVTGWGSYSLTM